MAIQSFCGQDLHSSVLKGKKMGKKVPPSAQKEIIINKSITYNENCQSKKGKFDKSQNICVKEAC